MNFPARDLSNQYISSSYQDVVQKYGNLLLDGLGNQIETLELSSSYSVFISSASFSSESISASYSNTSSWAINAINGGTQLITASLYPITSSWAIESVFSNTASISVESVFSETSSLSVSSSHAVVADRLVDSGLTIPQYDYSHLEYLGPDNQVSTCSYRFGGISGSIVSVLTLLYSGSLFIGVSKSLS